MSPFFKRKKFDDIKYDDIVNFIKQRVPESNILEYKKDFSRDNKKRIITSELGKDVSSFANTEGGWLLYGIATDKDKNIEICYPKEQIEEAIIGLESEPGLEKKIEDMILGAISPKPFFRIKSIRIKNTEKCIIVIWVRQSYDAVHMVVTKKEMRFYKRYNFQAIPMDEREIELRFKAIGQTEKERKDKINKIKAEGEKWSASGSNNLFGLFAIPKFFLKNYFNDKKKIEKFFKSKLIEPFEINTFRRWPNKFCYNLTDGAIFNFYYDGSISLVMPLNNPYFIENANNINPLFVYSVIYRFLCIIEKYYSLFDYYGIFELHFELRGIRGKHLLNIEYDSSGKPKAIPSKGSASEELEPFIKICDIMKLQTNKTSIAQEMILPLFYCYNIDLPIEIWDIHGFPKVDFNKEFWENDK